MPPSSHGPPPRPRRPAVAQEYPAQDAGNGEHEVPLRDGREDLVRELLDEERGALGLAAGAEGNARPRPVVIAAPD